MFVNDSEIEALGHGFLSRTLPKSAWTHAAHFATALWLIRRRPDLPARTHMPGLIRAYNEATGVVNSATAGYHQTITLASLAAAEHHASCYPDEPLHAVVATLLAGPCGNQAWPLTHWSNQLLFSQWARASWTDPDVAPLPFSM